MYKNRLIPKLILKRSPLNNDKIIMISTLNFKKFFSIGDPYSQTKIFNAQSADELIILNIESRKIDKKNIHSLLKKITNNIFIPITYGGGIKTIIDIREYLLNGADKISINTQAVYNPEIINKASKIFGSSTIAVSIDYKLDKNGKRKVYIENGKKETNLDPLKWSKECEERGAGEILLCDIDRDGTKTGLDLNLISTVTKNLSIPVIASGGCGLAEHFVQGYKNAQAHAVAASTYFNFKDQGFMQIRSLVKNSGVSVRLNT